MPVRVKERALGYIKEEQGIRGIKDPVIDINVVNKIVEGCCPGECRSFKVIEVSLKDKAWVKNAEIASYEGVGITSDEKLKSQIESKPVEIDVRGFFKKKLKVVGLEVH